MAIFQNWNLATKLIILGAVFHTTNPALAQVVPDNTLPTNSVKAMQEN